jgi:hypothetical protein
MTWLSLREMIDRIVRECENAGPVCATPNTPKALLDRLGPRVMLPEQGQKQADLWIITATDVSESGDVAWPSGPMLPVLPNRSIAWIVPAPAMLFSTPIQGESIRVQKVLFEGGLLDVTPNGLLLREVPTGISARQVQARSHATLWADRELQVVAR